MSCTVKKDSYSISADRRSLISKRYKSITQAINQQFWNSDSETAHSRYVGSYGRGTAIDESDLDVLVELPDEEFDHFSSLTSNGPSRLLQAVKDAIINKYPNTDIKGDGQVVVVIFSDGMRFEILPAFKMTDFWGNWDGRYKYPNSHMGGNWLSTNPLSEQEAMAVKNASNQSNGLLYDTCKHIRYVKKAYFSSYHLSGILIDSFIYKAIGSWRWLNDDEQGSGKEPGEYERSLYDYYLNQYPYPSLISPAVYAPGSGDKVAVDDWEILGKVLKKIAE